MNPFKCAACPQIITDKYYLTCSTCEEKYDLDCASVSIQRFRNTMTIEHRNKWQCQTCICNIRKKIQRPTSPYIKIDKEFENNITFRKPKNLICLDSSDEETSIAGDTQIPHNNYSSSMINSITIQQLETLLDSKLQATKQAIISEINSSFTLHVNSAISKLKQEIYPAINSLQSQQECINEDIKLLNKRINDINNENLQLKNDLKRIQDNFICDNNTTNKKTILPKENNDKKFILYGIKSSPWENEDELHEQILHIFRDILNVNLAGYIEDIKRLGRKGPVMIELLSKKTTNYILQNSSYFKDTGLSVAEYLSENSRAQRKQLIQILIKARQNGSRANIFNNQLYINGKVYDENKSYKPTNPAAIPDKQIEELNLMNNNNHNLPTCNTNNSTNISIEQINRRHQSNNSNFRN